MTLNLYKELSAPLGWNIINNKLIKKLESIGTKFGDKYNTKSGIATLRNKVYIFNPVKTNSKYHVSGYFGLGKNHLDNFGIYNFNEKDIKLLVCTKSINKSDAFIAKKYKFTSSD